MEENNTRTNTFQNSPTDIFNYFQNQVLEKRNSSDDDAEGILSKRDDPSPTN